MRVYKTVIALAFQGAVAGLISAMLFLYYMSNLPTPAPAQVIQALPVEEWRVQARIWGERLGLPPQLLEGLCDYESGEPEPRAAALSTKGAVGPCQVMPASAAYVLGIHRPTTRQLAEIHMILSEDEFNVMFGGRILSFCYRRNWHKNIDVQIGKALWCYNNGHRRRPRSKSVFANRVIARWDKIRAAEIKLN